MKLMELDAAAQLSAPKQHLGSPPSSSLIVADPEDLPSPTMDGRQQAPSQDRTLQLDADVSLQRTEQRPPERSLIEQEGLPISPIETTEADATVDGLRLGNEEHGSL